MPAPDHASVARARDIAQELRLRFARVATPLAISQSQDTNGNPLIVVGSVAAAGTAGFTIRFRPIDWPNVQTSIGLAQPVYGPHVTEVVWEAGISLDTIEDIAQLLLTLGKRGTRMAIYSSPNGTAADFTQLIPANLVTEYLPDFTGMNAVA